MCLVVTSIAASGGRNRDDQSEWREQRRRLL